MKVTAKSKIGEIVAKHPKTVEVFLKHGLHCIGCFASQFETLKQGCKAHGIDCEKLVEDLNKAIEEDKK
ncbi:disulfide oxidoreductase [Candidatus Woesearchaeota archaeon]|nr:MAG: disulfide oxidoreductase [Candidatus Woesearchaeota archaeon]